MHRELVLSGTWGAFGLSLLRSEAGECAFSHPPESVILNLQVLLFYIDTAAEAGSSW